MTQGKEPFLVGLGRWLTGRKNPSNEQAAVEPGDRAITAATRSLALDMLNETPSHERFAPKEVVVWKWGMKNKAVPLAGQTALVMKVREEALIDDTQQPSSTYYLEPLDVLIGVYTHEGIFRELWVDGRRLCHRADQRARSSALVTPGEAS
tara:strand:+ start:765 stop:1217 length:453 start_codon:yes stop_codon:yes gene_type:complete